MKVCQGTALPSSPTEVKWLRLAMEQRNSLQHIHDTDSGLPAQKEEQIKKATHHPGDICVKALPSSGAQFVLDPSVVHPCEEFMYLYSVQRGEMREYEVSRIAALKEVSDEERKNCLEHYYKWKMGNYSEFLDSLNLNKEQIRSAALEQRKRNATERKMAEDAKKAYRATHCHSCKTPLDNVSGRVCSRCGGIKCICGSCLCQLRN